MIFFPLPSDSFLQTGKIDAEVITIHHSTLVPSKKMQLLVLLWFKNFLSRY